MRVAHSLKGKRGTLVASCNPCRQRLSADLASDASPSAKRRASTYTAATLTSCALRPQPFHDLADLLAHPAEWRPEKARYARPPRPEGKAGSAIPVKFKLPDGRGGFLCNLQAVKSIEIHQVSCGSFVLSPTDAIEETATPTQSVRCDAGQYT